MRAAWLDEGSGPHGGPSKDRVMTSRSCLQLFLPQPIGSVRAEGWGSAGGSWKLSQDESSGSVFTPSSSQASPCYPAPRHCSLPLTFVSWTQHSAYGNRRMKRTLSSVSWVLLPTRLSPEV